MFSQSVGCEGMHPEKIKDGHWVSPRSVRSKKLLGKTTVKQFKKHKGGSDQDLVHPNTNTEVYHSKQRHHRSLLQQRHDSQTMSTQFRLLDHWSILFLTSVKTVKDPKRQTSDRETIRLLTPQRNTFSSITVISQPGNNQVYLSIDR